MLTVFTVANRTYERFVLPYIVSVLYHNVDAKIEILLEQPRRFEADNADALEIIDQTFGGGRVVFGRGNFAKISPNALRFAAQPETKNDYVYIGDIDVLVLEALLEPHLEHMRKTGLPYSNIIRPGQKRLTGLHFSSWDALYPIPPRREGTPSGYDELILYEIIEDKGLPLPALDDGFRPVHGFHITLSRPPAPGWGGVKSPEFVDSYLLLSASKMWARLLPLFDPKYLMLLTILESIIFTIHPDKFRPCDRTIFPVNL